MMTWRVYRSYNGNPRRHLVASSHTHHGAHVVIKRWYPDASITYDARLSDHPYVIFHTPIGYIEVVEEELPE